MPAKAPARTENKVSPSATAPQKRFSLISDDKLREMYTAMLRCRMLQERAAQLATRSRRNGLRPTAIGHEAATVGVAIDLLPGDIIAAAHGDLLSGFLKGAPLSAALHPPLAASSNGHAPLPLIPPASTAEAQLSIATGAAFAAKIRHNGSITIAFAGNLSAPAVLWRNTLAFAAAHKLPIIYVVQSDPSQDLSQIALDCGLAGIPVDGADVVAVYRVAYETITRMRRGNGPTLIECRQPDTSPANKAHHSRDPIQNMESYLTGKGLFTEKWKQQIVSAFGRELDAAAKSAGTLPSRKNTPRPAVPSAPRKRKPLAPQVASVTR
jgi:TPP-dependent pyruvate/acetoin dehydrogenase alpha subunit